jgi:dienelactone hydrolase
MTQAPMGPITLQLGGTAQGNEAAEKQAWPRVFSFLTAALHA